MILRHPVDFHSPGNFNGKKASVKAVSLPDAPTVYVLYDADGRHVATCSSPKPLASHAFNAGAREVAHEYDLRAAE